MLCGDKCDRDKIVRLPQNWVTKTAGLERVQLVPEWIGQILPSDSDDAATTCLCRTLLTRCNRKSLFQFTIVAGNEESIRAKEEEHPGPQGGGIWTCNIEEIQLACWSFVKTTSATLVDLFCGPDS
ncbi:uncharacterized protein M437DRAFT_64151 [Aureobasidium melanogenum CBS 110374]|uniref:Uncharacterized protein n=1 Tax=Aureobasidium melanogenum (strain CBS 110374) TaxID=1043003 RepID=A0A074VYZ5_AURM1|nr:uncharacterized protein M437DRAFT_64151 [Aureobasidium melanogenum CBS 110374]KEQ64499.1 hypothetical protein M437DRAFT_64151 [Aureobasidium melanogenum CBS 110374]